MNRIYCAIGKIVEVTQFIELRLGEICEKSEIIKEFSRHVKMTKEIYAQIESDASYIKDKMLTMTFGAMIGVIYESKSLSYDETTELKTLLEKRNYFTHEYFKYTSFVNAKEQDIIEEFDALKEYLAKLKKFLNRLDIIYFGQKERLEYLLAKNNL